MSPPSERDRVQSEKTERTEKINKRQKQKTGEWTADQKNMQRNTGENAISVTEMKMEERNVSRKSENAYSDLFGRFRDTMSIPVQITN